MLGMWEKDAMGSHEYNGVTAVMMVFLTRTNHEILGIRQVTLNEKGELTEMRMGVVGYANETSWQHSVSTRTTRRSWRCPRPRATAQSSARCAPSGEYERQVIWGREAIQWKTFWLEFRLEKGIEIPF